MILWTTAATIWTNVGLVVFLSSTAILLLLAYRFYRVRAAGYAGREQLFGLARRRYKTIYCSGCRWRIQSLTAKEKATYEASILAPQNGSIKADALITARQRLLCLCLVDSEGRQLLSLDDEKKLGDLDGRDVTQLWDACREWVGFSDYDIRELTDAAELLQAMGGVPQKQEHPNARQAKMMAQRFGGRN